MSIEPTTFRNHFLSVYQSTIGSVLRAGQGADAALGTPELESGIVKAATAVAALKDSGAALPTVAPFGLSQNAWNYARLTYELMEAKAAGNGLLAAEKADELKFSGADPQWVETVTEYVGYFGPCGTRRVAPYIPPNESMQPLPMPLNATVALLADWGTGTDSAINLLRGVAQQKPDILIHLGDIYYSGTPDECDANFKRIIDQVFQRTGAATDIPVFTIPGNHDMYSGGKGFYDLIKTLNPPSMRQPASFFCLRDTENERWQFVAMDTALHDYNPFTVTDVITYVEPPEESWLTAQVQLFPGKTILLSHHQLFSALAKIGPAAADGSYTAYNPRLAAMFNRMSNAAPGRIAAWFWGHEHALTMYGPYMGLSKGRCIGHGAVPVLVGTGDTVLPQIRNPPPILSVPMGADDQIYTHGFAIVRFAADGSAQAFYFDDTDFNTPIHVENL
jgi:Calcineurin-like phosphoesterase